MKMDMRTIDPYLLYAVINQPLEVVSDAME